MCDSGGNGGNYGNKCVVSGVSGGSNVGGDNGNCGSSGSECVVGGVSDGSNVSGDNDDNNNSVSDLSSIRNCITNSSGENKLLQCVLFFDEYRKLRRSEISSSNTTFMSRTIRPMVMCFRNHNHSNPHLFLNRFDIDTSIYNFGKKKCQGKVNTNCLLN